MRPIALCSRLALLVVAVATLVHAPLTAQVEPERPRVALTQMPELTNELWPGDFNEDGVTDLVAAQAGLGIVVRLGIGDGTFTGSSVIHGTGTPVGVGDINKDGFIDVLGLDPGPNNTTISLLFAGKGDGTFLGPLVLSQKLGMPTYVIDLNNDGLMDLLAAQYPPSPTPSSTFGGDILIYPGNGDFTFGPVVSLRPGNVLVAIAPADLNGDGLIDIAAHSTFGARPPNAGRLIDIFENQGNFAFAHTTIPTEAGGAGIAARDLNADGIVDLIAGFGSWSTTYWNSGFIHVMLGTGGGAFAPPVQYPVNVGPVHIVTGDFNGDRIPDIATGNQSTVQRCEDQLPFLWDSISILPGRGDGTFGPTASFALGNSEASPDASYRRSLTRLNTSDLNADGRTDLLVSRGAILLMRPPGPNTAPVASAGADRYGSENDLNQTLLRGSAFDADADWLTFQWKDDLGRVYPALPQTCFSVGLSVATRIFTLTATDELGGTSSDSMRWTFSGAVPAPGPIPQTFTAGNIGDATSGFDGFSVNNGVFRIAGSGTDVWDTFDSFRFVQTALSGDFDVITKVISLENVDPWTKAGLMVRETLTPTSRHASLFATPTSVNGVAFQRREAAGGASIHTSGPSVAPPVWLRLVRQGDQITALTRLNESDAWSVVGTQTLAGLTTQVHVGLAVTSHRTGGLATAQFGDFTINGQPPPSPPALPAGWTATDVGSVMAAGSATFAGDAFTVNGSGADIWDSADAFHYVYMTLPGDGTAIIRMPNLSGSHEWAKSGLMIRQSLSPSAPHHFLLRSVAHGAAWQWRLAAGEATQHSDVAPLASSGSIWYRIERVAGIVRLAYSLEFPAVTEWTPIGEAPFPMGEALIGLAVTSHADGTLARGTFDRVTFEGATPAPPPATGWASALVGAVGVAGSSQFDGVTHTLSASGSDIWDTSDAFRFTYQTLPGNGSIVARIASMAGPNEWTKAGVMIRASLSPGAAHGYMLLSRDFGLAFQRRTSEGGATTHTGVNAATPPQWVRLTRNGQVVTAATAADGVTWTEAGSETLAIGTGPVLVGLAVTSHDNGVAATATFDNVTVGP